MITSTVVGFYSIWPAFALMAAAVMVASTKLFRKLDNPPEQVVRRDLTIDGLRAFLAMAVFFHHLSIRRAAVDTGIVALPPSQFYAMLGSFGVAIFFMITGYLFWGKLLRSRGCVDWSRLYVSRFFRIVPLYLFLIVIYIATVMIASTSRWDADLPLFVRQASKWLAFGLWPTPSPLLGDVSKMPLVGQAWTLFFEWVFYLSLPLWALFARMGSKGVLGPAVALLLIYALGMASAPLRFYAELFLAGMATASVLEAVPPLRGDSAIKSIAACALLLTAFLLRSTAYDDLSIVLLAGFFALVASGASLFGLLLTRGATRIGHASYSVYLLQGVVLMVIFAPSVLGMWATISPVHFWLVAVLTTVCLLGVASATYLWIEKPGITAGCASRDRIRRHKHRPALTEPLD